AGRIASKSRSLFRIIILRAAFACHREPWFAKTRRPKSAAASKPPLQPPFLQKSIVMAHQQMRFHLAHGVEQHTHSDEHARAAEKLGHLIRYLHLEGQKRWNHRRSEE